MLIDQIDLRVKDLGTSRRFYDPPRSGMGFSHFDVGGVDGKKLEICYWS
jgi:hypothetical protein